MKVIRRVQQMRSWVRGERMDGRRIGFVPTMGALHDGHVSLMERARRAVGEDGRVVVSVYVNPTQFGPAEDFSRYPRPVGEDRRRCEGAGVDILFVPSDEEVYGARGLQDFSTFVEEQELSRLWEGEKRPGHFRGVTTVVSKLFHMVEPDVAVFGEKDYQQAAVIRRMVRDLNMAVRVVVGPTVRERDGLALSSRNAYLNPEERQRATILRRALGRARERVGREKKVSAARLQRDLERFMEKEGGARVDYVALVDGETLQPVRQVEKGHRILLAVWIGQTRLIDNAAV